MFQNPESFGFWKGIMMQFHMLHHTFSGTWNQVMYKISIWCNSDSGGCSPLRTISCQCGPVQTAWLHKSMLIPYKAEKESKWMRTSVGLGGSGLHHMWNSSDSLPAPGTNVYCSAALTKGGAHIPPDSCWAHFVLYWNCSEVEHWGWLSSTSQSQSCYYCT